MAKLDLYNLLKDRPNKSDIIKKDVFELVDKLLKLDPDLTDAQRHKLARLRAYIEINFKKF